MTGTATGPRSYACTFTVFTPTWNRAHTLSRVYSSLQEQSFKDFEWLIVDDGSEDGTAELVAGWTRESTLSIRYLHKPHLGLHHAYNTGVSEARGEFFLPIGSDDQLVPQALDRLLAAWNSISETQREEFTGVCCLCMDETGAVLGDQFPKPVLDCTALELRYLYSFKAETSGFHRTEILRQYPFPDDERIQFVPESIVWNVIAKSYRLRCINEALRVYLRGEDSICTAIGMARRLTENCYGFCLQCRAVLENELEWFRFAPLHFLLTAANYSRFWLHCRQRSIQGPPALTSRWARSLIFLMAPLGILKFLRDQHRLRRSISPERSPK